ncbi:MAG: hypothetical protein B6D39_04760 [Anaerolineae bacterium UTCFX2]|jgi:hypothetical protein|nr:hypothetical protein [Anaerolineae bacterium]MCZ7553743.1 hypothetical protein [Anaerolineales bacterium]OQY92339.1 MAG: hypothetical protein B6D39_04760 [Anaerolineae bacterium UTCFX2]
MKKKWNMQISVTGVGALLLLFAVCWMLTPKLAQAQCGDIPESSSCYHCHQEQGAFPVYGKGDWHDVHAVKDCCWNCHGGNALSNDADLAHTGMLTNPLADIYTDCYACHPGDYQERADKFAVLLGVTPESRPTPTAHPAIMTNGQPLVLQPPASSYAANQPAWIGLLAGLSILIVFLLLLLLLTRINANNKNHQVQQANET